MTLSQVLHARKVSSQTSAVAAVECPFIVLKWKLLLCTVHRCRQLGAGQCSVHTILISPRARPCSLCGNGSTSLTTQFSTCLGESEEGRSYSWVNRFWKLTDVFLGYSSEYQVRQRLRCCCQCQLLWLYLVVCIP